MLIYYQLCGGSLLPQCCFGLFFFTVTLRRSLPNISYFNAHITADWFPCVSRGQWDTSATWFNTSVLFCNIFFSYSDGNIARRLMNSCTKQLLCSRMSADMWNRHMSGFLLWNWQAVNFTHVLGNFCKVRVNPDLLISDDCCQILNRFRHSHHSRVTLAKTPEGKKITAISPSWAHAHEALCFCQWHVLTWKEKRSMVVFDGSHLWVCEREPTSGIQLLFWQ